MDTSYSSRIGGTGTMRDHRQIFRLMREADYPGIYRRVPITPGLVNDVASLLAHLRRVGAVAEAVARNADGLPGLEAEPAEILESAYCQLAGRHLGRTVFFDEDLVAEVYDAIEGARYREFLECLLQSQPLSGMDYHNRGNARAEAGDRTGALADYTRAIEAEPRTPRYYLSRARFLLEQQGDPRSASIDLRSAGDLADPARDPSLLDMPVLKARVLLAQGEPVGAIRALKEFVRDAGAAVATGTWRDEGDGRGEPGSGVAALLDAVVEALEVLESLPADEDARLLEHLLHALAARL